MNIRMAQIDPELPFKGDCTNGREARESGVASASQYALDDFGHEPEYSAQIEEAWTAH